MDPERVEHIDTRAETLTVACAICRRPKSACRPDCAGPPVCRRCALQILPRIIAQAVLADPDTGRPMHDAMMATAEAPARTTATPSATTPTTTRRCSRSPRLGDGGPGDGPGWEGYDDEDDDWGEWADDDAGEGPPPASAMPGGVEADHARQVGEGAE